MFGRIVIGMVAALLLALPAAAQDLSAGESAYERGDYATAFKEFRPLADDGEPRAQYYLGLMYEYGKGVPRDYGEAVKWHRKASERGNPDAKVNLELIHMTGRALQDKVSPAPAMGRSIAFQRPREAVNGGTVRVQLGAVRTQARAMGEARRLARVHGSVLGEIEIAPVRADLGRRGVFYRLQAGPLPDRAAAAALCRELSARNQDCVVARP